MSWATVASLVLDVIQLSTSFLSWLRTQQALDAARDRELAKAALALLDLTQEGQALRARIARLSDDDSVDLWRKMLED